MQVSQAAAIWIQYHKSYSRPNTLKAYRVVLSRFCHEFGDRGHTELTSEEILSFLSRMTEAPKQPTSRLTGGREMFTSLEVTQDLILYFEKFGI